MKSVVWWAVAIMVAACSKDSATGSSGAGSQANAASEVFPEGYRKLSIGMPFEEAVKAFVVSGKHDMVSGTVNLGSDDVEDPSVDLPTAPAEAVAVLTKLEQDALKKVGQSKDGAELEEAIAKHGRTSLYATTAEDSPYASVTLEFDEGKLFSAKFDVRTKGVETREMLMKQLVAKLGKPRESTNRKDLLFVDKWSLCDLGIDYDMMLSINTFDGKVAGANHSIEISKLPDALRSDHCPSTPKL